MAKHDLDRHLRSNPKARKHARVIKETLKALDSLKNAGFQNGGYTLASPYGGNKAPHGTSTRKVPVGMKMTYCA